jgi:hypothetical protein
MRHCRRGTGTRTDTEQRLASHNSAARPAVAHHKGGCCACSRHATLRRLVPLLQEIRMPTRTIAPPAARTRPAPSAPAAPTPPLTRPLRLVRGQALHVYVARGTVLHLQRGSAVLKEAAWDLSDRPWRPQQHLRAGAVWVAQRAGWVELSAQQQGSLLLLRDDATPGWCLRAGQALWRWLRA